MGKGAVLIDKIGGRAWATHAGWLETIRTPMFRKAALGVDMSKLSSFSVPAALAAAVMLAGAGTASAFTLIEIPRQGTATIPTVKPPSSAGTTSLSSGDRPSESSGQRKPSLFSNTVSINGLTGAQAAGQSALESLNGVAVEAVVLPLEAGR